MGAGPESKAQTKVLRWLASQGAYTTKIVASSKSGKPDILACVPCVITADMVGMRVGLFVAMEMKSLVGDATDLQDYNLACIQQAGGVGGVVRSVDDAKALLER